MSDISEANAKIARQEHIKTQQERLEQLEREQEGEQQLKAAYIKNIAELNNDVAELRTKIEQLEQELGQAEVKLEKQEAELRVTRYGAWSGVDVKAACLAATEDAARIAEEMYDRELPELHHIEIAISDEIYAAIREGK